MKKGLIIISVILIIIIGLGVYLLSYLHIIPSKSYTAKDFGIENIISQTDYDSDGVDDFTDILIGARMYLKTNPHYKSAYYEGGYPPDNEGVCTDVIWKAFKNAGYSLKDLVNKDIAENTDVYPGTNGKPDPNIDFRRVRNLVVFFDRYAVPKPLDTSDIAAWQPGDIAIFPAHIAIVSDKRNKNGVPYILHNAGQPVKEENVLNRYEIIGHYRWNGELVAELTEK